MATGSVPQQQAEQLLDLDAQQHTPPRSGQQIGQELTVESSSLAVAKKAAKQAARIAAEAAAATKKPAKRKRDPKAAADGVPTECPKCGKTAADFAARARGLRAHIPQCAHIDHWTQCTSCSKWRRLNEFKIREPWICKYNPDERFNRCEIAQELTNQQIDDEIAASYG